MFGLAVVAASALGARPAAARHNFRHPEHKDIERVSKEPFGNIPKGPLQIFISIDQQKLHLYSDGVRVADTSIATGVPSLPTPFGVFSVIQKQIFHRSNIYSGAPMPFMQRITWSGVAMHEGEGIGHRASHGCIRMPHDFAVRLYHLTKLGVPVIIARSELEPAAFADPHLFVHKAPPAQQIAAAPAASLNSVAAAPTADAAPPVSLGAPNPAAIGLRVSVESGAAAPNAVADAAIPDPPVNDAAKSAAPAAGMTSTAASSDPKSETPAPAPVAVADAAKPNATANDAAKSAAPATNAAAAAAAGVPDPPADPPGFVHSAPANKDPIAIFISRKQKKIYVRQDFAPLFEAPVTIADPDKPFGTQVFTALDFTGDDRTTLRWNVVTLPGESPPQRKIERAERYERYARGRRGVKEYHEGTGDPAPSPPPAEVLARIEIPQAVIDFICQLIVPGSSLIVSDHGLGDETGEGTNFIVVTR
jgi:L,D-transpeptidase catalytic domain